MIQVLSDKRALSILGGYFNLMSRTGYVKSKTLSRFLAYSFLVSFVRDVADYLTEEDYDIIARALGRLFVNGDCLLPYPVFCHNRATLGKARYMGDVNLRVTEGVTMADRIKRVTEDDDLRRTE